MIQNSNRHNIMQTRKENSAYRQHSFLGTLLRFVMVLTMLCTVGVQSAWGDTYTFDMSKYSPALTDTKGETIILKSNENDGFTIQFKERSDKDVTAGSSAQKFPDNEQWTTYFKTDGGSNTSGNYFEITLTEASNIKVYARGGGTSARDFYITTSTDHINDGQGNLAIGASANGSSAVNAVINADAPTGKVYVGVSNGTYIYAIVVTTLAQPPVFTTDLDTESYKLNVGGSLDLTVAATASGAVTYQWYKATKEDLSDAVALAGATNAAYTYSPSREEYVYLYCQATNTTDGSTANSKATLVSAITSHTFGIGRILTGTTFEEKIEHEIGSKPTGVSLTVNVPETFVGNRTDLAHGDATRYSGKDNIYSATVLSNPDNGPIGFDISIPVGYKLNISNLLYDIYSRAGKTLTMKVLVTKGSNVLYETEKFSSAPETKAPYGTFDTSSLLALQGLEGNISIKIFWGINSSVGYFIIKDLNITATLEKYVLKACAPPIVTDKETYVPAEEAWQYELETETEGAELHYTINGGEENVIHSVKGIINVPNDAAVVVWAEDPFGVLTPSEHTEFTGVPMPKVPNPTIALSTYSVSNKNFTVTLGGAQASATIYYTTDGTNPTSGSSAYSAPFTVGGNTTVKAIAIQENYANSSVVSKKTLNPVSPGEENISGTNGTSGDNVGEAYTLPSTHVGGSANHTTGGVKMNPRKINAQNANGIHIDVNPGFVITKIEGEAVNNYAGDVNLTAIHVDGSTTDNVLDGAPVTVHDSGTTPHASFSTTDIQAKTSLDLMIDCSQVNMLIKVYYEFQDEITGIKVNGEAISDAAFTEAKTDAGHTISTHFASTPTVKVVTREGYEYDMHADADAEGVYTFTYTMLGQTVKVLANDVLPGEPTITVDQSKFVLGGFPVTNIVNPGTIMISIDGSAYETYDKAKEYKVRSTVSAYSVFKEQNTATATVDVDYATAWRTETGKAFKAGKPIVIWLNKGIAANQAGTIGQKLETDYNVYDVNASSSTWEKLQGADLLVISEGLGGADGIGLDIKNNLLGKMHIINMKLFTYGSSTKDHDRWAWGLPVEETIGNTSLSMRVANPLAALFEGVQLKERETGEFWVDLWTKDADAGKKHMQYLSYVNNDAENAKDYQNIAYAVGGQIFMHGADHAIVADGTSKSYMLIGMNQEDIEHYSPDAARLISNAVAIMCDPAKSLFDEVTTLPIPTVEDADDGSANVATATTLAKIYYTTTAAASPAPTKESIKTGGKYTLTGKTEKFSSDVYVWAFAELTKTDGTTISSDVTTEGTLIKGNNNRIVTLTSDPKDLAEGTTVNAIYDATQTHTVPYNTSFYKPGKTVKKWIGSDGNEYIPGAANFMGGNIQDITLTAVFEDNDVKLTDATVPTTVTWDFRTSHNAPRIAVENGSSGGQTAFIIGHAIINSKLLDVRLDINAATSHVNDSEHGGNGEDVTGKFNNTYSGKYAQVRHSTEFTFPAVYGMEVSLCGVDFPTDEGNIQYFKTTENGNSTLTDGAYVRTVDNDSPDHGGHGIFSFSGESAKATLAQLDPGAICYQDFTYAAGTKNEHTYNVGDINYGGGFYQSLSVTYPALYTVVTSVTPTESEFAKADAEGKTEAAGQIEQSAAHQNTDGKFLPGDNVTVKTKPNYGYAFNNITKGGDALTATDGEGDDAGKKVATYTIQQSDEKTVSIVANYNAQTAYTITAVAKYADGETPSTKTAITASPDYKKYVAGTEVTLTGDFEITYGPKEWKMNDAKVADSDRQESVTITMPAQNTTVDLLIQLMSRADVNYDKGTTEFTVLPQDITDTYSVTPPIYHTLYQEGKTLTNWVGNGVYGVAPGTVADADRSFSLGKETGLREGPNGEKLTYTLTPKYLDNTQPQRLGGRSKPVEIIWHLTTDHLAQSINVGTNNEFSFTAPVTVTRGSSETAPFDVCMSIKTGKRGKMNNQNNGDWCILGNGTVLTVPACNGATVEMEVRNKILTTTFGDKVPEISKVRYTGEAEPRVLDPDETKSIVSYIYNMEYEGNDKTLDIKIGSDYSYYRYVKVILPEQTKEHEVAIVNTDWTNWDEAVGGDGHSGGHAGASSLSGTDKQSTGFKTHFTNEDITLQTYGIAINKTRYTGLYVVKYGLDGYITINNKQGDDAPYMKMGQFKNVTHIKFRQGSSQANGSGWKVTVKGVPEGETEEVERIIREDGKCNIPEWVDLDVYMNNCTITFENITSTESSPYEAAMFDLQIFGADNTTNSQMYIKTSVNDELAGQIKASPDYRAYPKNDDRTLYQFEDGSKVTLTAEANAGWNFVKWQEENADGTYTDLSTDASYTINNLESDRNIHAVFERTPVFTFIFGGHNYAGSVPESQQVKRYGTFAIPYNRTLYKDDNSTLVGWEMTQYDGSTKHQFNTAATADAPQTFKSGDSWYHENLYDINLSPIMQDNNVSLLDIDQKFTEGVKARWYFGPTNGAPELNVENKVGFLMTQAQVTDDEFIDLRMYIDALTSTGRGKGKVNNVGRWDNRAQVNATTLFTIPATKGMKLEIAASSAINNTLFGDADASSVVDDTEANRPKTTGTTATWTYLGSNDKATIDVYDGSYYEYIEATYYPRLSKPTIRMNSLAKDLIKLKITTTAESDPTAITYYSTDGSIPTIDDAHKVPADGIISFTPAENGNTVKAITISDNRPDSEIESYMVAPYDPDRRTVTYLYNGKQPGYSINNDIMYRTLMFGAANNYDAVHKSGCNVIAHDVSTPDFAANVESDRRNNWINNNSIYVAPDGLIAPEAPLPGIADDQKTNIRAYIADLTGHDHVVVTPMTVVGKLLGRTPVAADLTDGIVTVPEGKDNLRMLDYVLMDKDNKICVSWTGDIAVNDLTLNAAYMLANSVKTIVEHYSGTDKLQGQETKTAAELCTEELALLGTQITENPQLRNQTITVFGEKRDATAKELADLVDGEMTIVLPKLPGTPSVIAAEAWVNGSKSTSDEAGKIVVAKDDANLLHSILTLTGNEQTRTYKIYATLSTQSDELIFTNDGNNTEEKYWSNGVWKVAQANGFVSGNNADVFKFNVNNDDIITISGPANYAIKSINFRGYHYVGGSQGGEESSLRYDFVNEPYATMQTDPGIPGTYDWKIYDKNDPVTADMKAEFGLYSINSVSFKLNEMAVEKKNGQAIGRFIVEYYLREATSMSLVATNTRDNAEKEHSGAVALEFTSLMEEVGKDAGVTLTPERGAAIPLAAAGNSQTLAFTYFGLEPGRYTLTIPFSALKDIDGNTFSGTESDAAVGKMTKSGDSYVVPVVIKAPKYERKTFDFIVNGIDHGTTWDGTFIDGINQIGNNTGDRKRMLFLNSKEEYFIAPGTPENHANGTSTKFTDADGKEKGGDGKGNEQAEAYNSHTRLTAKNISFIGESQKGVVIANLPELESMSSTPTIEFKTKDCTDNYMQDITIRNKYPYVLGVTGRATAFYNAGMRTVMKRVRLESYQDTYYSSGTHTYAEDCTFMGVVDFIYGSGDHWYENCNILLRNRYGNNIVAPSTSPSEKWGFVMNNCTIDKEEGATMVTDRNWTLARPWQGSPAATFLNTKMNVVPNNVGYAYMSATPLVIRFHEYGSKDKDDVILELASRSIAICAPAVGSDSPVLTESQAAKYDVHTVIGGDDGYDPTEHTMQIDKINSLYVDGQTLLWKDNEKALCYFVYYLGDGAEPNIENPVLVANYAPAYQSGEEVGFNLFENHVFRGKQTFEAWYNSLQKGGKVMKTSDEFSHGWFGIRAANQRGGLNEMSNVVEYHKARIYNAYITDGGKEDGDDSGNVWSSIYLDFNAKVPNNVIAYALVDVTAFGGDDVTETTVHLQRVSNSVSTEEKQDIIYRNMGYILYGPGPSHPTKRMTTYNFVETGHMNVVEGTEEEARENYLKSYLSGTVGVFDGSVSSNAVGEDGINGWSSSPVDYSDVPVGYTSAYTLATKTLENTRFGVGFYKYKGQTFGHHKAYLDTDAVSQLLASHGVSSTNIDEMLARGMTIMVHDIDDVVTKVITVKGKQILDSTDRIYNISGQQVRPEMMHKGEIYIINGQKIRY